MSTVQQDDRGIFIRLNGANYRPGTPRYTLRPDLRHDAGDLKKGDKVRARIMACTPIIVVLVEGGPLYWEDRSYWEK